jgi:hypothetical protein
MPHIIIHTEELWLGLQVEGILGSLDSTDIDIKVERTWSYELVYSATCVRSKCSEILEVIKPLRPKKRMSHDLESDLYHIYLGSSRQLKEFPIQLKTDSRQLLDHLEQQLASHFYCNTRLGAPTQSVLKFGGAPAFVCDCIIWICHQQGRVDVSLDPLWSEDANDIHLFIQDPQRRGKDFRQNLVFIMIIDEEDETVEQILKDLRQGGYQPTLEVCPIEQWPKESRAQAISINQSEFILDLAEGKRLIDTLGSSLDKAGINMLDYPPLLKQFPSKSIPPLQPLDTQSNQSMTESISVYLPLKQLRQGLIIPNGGSSPRRWTLDVKIDDATRGQSLISHLREIGFSQVSTSSYPVDEPLAHRGGVHIDWGSAAKFPTIKVKVLNALSLFGQTPVIIDHLSVLNTSIIDDKERLNHIKVSVCVDDFLLKAWHEKLDTHFQKSSLILVTYDGEVHHALHKLISMPWSHIDVMSHASYSQSSPPFMQDENASRSAKDMDQWDEEFCDEEFCDEDSGDWDKSELQDWLMNSLHEGDNSELEDIVITYGGTPLFVIEWLRNFLEESLDLKVDIQMSLPLDDYEVMIELMEDLNDREDEQQAFDIRLEHSQTLLTPPEVMLKEQRSFEGLRLEDVLTIDIEQASLVWNNMTLQINDQQPISDDLGSSYLVFHPHFMKLCDFLFRAIECGQSKIISAPSKVGLSSALSWLAQVTHSLLITSETKQTSQTLKMLSQVRTQRLPLVVIDDYDLLSPNLRAHIRRALISLSDGSVSQRPIMIAGLSTSFYDHGQQTNSTGISASSVNPPSHFEGFEIDLIAKYTMTDWYQMFCGCYRKYTHLKVGTNPINGSKIDRLFNDLADKLYRVNRAFYKCHEDASSRFANLMGIQSVIHIVSNMFDHDTDVVLPFGHYFEGLYSHDILGEIHDDIWDLIIHDKEDSSEF